MNRIRVLIANQPRLMRELIRTTMADQPDSEDGILNAMRQGPQVVGLARI